MPTLENTPTPLFATSCCKGSFISRKYAHPISGRSTVKEVGLRNEGWLSRYYLQWISLCCMPLHNQLCTECMTWDLHALCIACLCLCVCNRLSVALAAHYGFLGSSSNRQVPKIVCALYVIQAVLLCLVCCSCSYSHEEIVPAHQETPGLVVVKPC